MPVLPSCPSPLTESARLPCRHSKRAKLSAVPIILLALLFLQLLSACTAPVRAPVSSREQVLKHSGPRPGYYRVTRGDTLYSIAWRYGLEFRKLAGWNRIRSPYTIYPGQRLRLSTPPASNTRSRSRSVNASRPPVKKALPAGKRAPVTKSQHKAGGATGLSWRWPTKGRLAQGFARGDPLRKGAKIGGRSGQSVVAAEAGKVVYAGSGLIGYGRLIIIKHNKSYLSAYGHNRRLLVKEGDIVSRGQQVAEMGRTGSGKAMLHFEIRRNGAPVDPLKLLPRRH